ncbi:MAG: hypothetical protein CK431_17025 [Mycobacterium sp.]|nr:MAG: hypothetical protein CK431_17025 [Mycobacterium sp.]
MHDTENSPAPTATEAAITMLGEPLAYELAEDDLPPAAAVTPDGDRRPRWLLAGAAFAVAAAALIGASAYGVQTMGGLSSTPVTVTAAPVTVTAPAPDRNAEFLSALRLAGIQYHYGGERAIHNAHAACVLIGTGTTDAEVASTIASMAQVDGPIGQQFVKLAKEYYCPGGHFS